MALKTSDRLSEAKDHLVDLLRLSPDDTWAYVLLGNIFARHEHDLETAERYYRKAMELAPQDTYALTNYAALKIERKDTEGARVLFEQAIGLAPKVPNPYYGLATLLNDAGKPRESLAVFERMFDTAEFDDLRMADLRKECREYFLRLNAHVAESDHEPMWQAVLSCRDELAQITALPVELVEDNSLEDTTAISVPAWRGDNGRHVVRYNSKGQAVVPHIVARELETIRMEHEARQAGKVFGLRYVKSNPERSEAIEAQVRRVSQGSDESEARAFVTKVTDTLMPRLLLTPIAVLVECRLRSRLPEIRPSQTTGLYLHSRQKRNPLDHPQVSRALPEYVRRAHETGGAAWAIFVDRMSCGRTDYAADYSRIHGLALARELADGWRKAADDFHPGDEYDLVRQFVKALRLELWLDIKPSAP